MSSIKIKMWLQEHQPMDLSLKSQGEDTSYIIFVYLKMEHFIPFAFLQSAKHFPISSVQFVFYNLFDSNHICENAQDVYCFH